MEKNNKLLFSSADSQNLPATTNGIQRGLENANSEDILIPRIKLLQALSPEVQEPNSNLKPGDFVNSVSGEKLPNPLTVIPILFLKSRIKFMPRESGGGIDCRSQDGIRPSFGKMYQAFCKICQFSQWNEDNGEAPLCTSFINFIVMLPDIPELSFISLSFGKTSYKAGQKMLSIAKFRGGDLFSYYYIIGSNLIRNPKGQFFVLTASPSGKVTAEQYQQAAQNYEILKSLRFDIHTEEEQQPIEENQSAPLF